MASNAKILELGYDEIIVSPLDTSKCQICLSQNQIEMLLALCLFQHWPTRWYSASGLVIDQGTIDLFVSAVEEELMSCCNDSVLTRVDEDGNWQTSYDGGETWVDTPNTDPRKNTPIFSPLPGDDGDSKRCDGANSIVTYFKNGVDEIAAAKDRDATLSDLNAVIVGFLIILGLISGGWMFAFLGALVGLIWANYDASEWRAAFPDEFWDSLVCIVYQYVNEDASVSDYQAMRSAVTAGLDDSIARQYIENFIGVLSNSGLTNAARAGYGGSRSCSCSDCESLDLWVAYYSAAGTITRNGDGTIDVVAVFDGLVGGYVAGIYTGDNTITCRFDNWENLSGAPTACIWVQGGETIPTYGSVWPHNAPLTDATDRVLCAIAAYSASPFTIRYHFSEP